MPTKRTFAIASLSPELAAALIAPLGKDIPYHFYVDERPDIRCDKCGCPVGDDGRFDPAAAHQVASGDWDDWD